MTKPETLAIGMALALGCRVNDWFSKAFSSKNLTDSRMKDRPVFLQLVPGETKFTALLSSEENVQLVKENLPVLLAAIETFKEAHVVCSSNLQDDISIARCQEQLDSESSRANLFYQRIQEWIKRSEELLRLNSQINPKDSTSQIGSRATSKSSARKSRRSSHSGSNRSGMSSLAFARAKEAARIAELEAEATSTKEPEQKRDEQQ